MKINAALIAVFVALSPTSAWSQENNSAVSSTIASSDRYEIVQSELAAKYTFRLDRFCGKVAQLVSDKDGSHLWENMEILLPKACTQDGKPRYQMFMSGLAAKFTFLMNTTTGETWQLVTSGQNSLVWQPIM